MYAARSTASSCFSNRIGRDKLTLACGSSPGLRPAGRGIALETRNWLANWAADTATGDAELPPPAALEFRLQLEDLGEMRRIYALPPL